MTSAIDGPNRSNGEEAMGRKRRKSSKGSTKVINGGNGGFTGEGVEKVVRRQRSSLASNEGTSTGGTFQERRSNRSVAPVSNEFSHSGLVPAPASAPLTLEYATPKLGVFNVELIIRTYEQIRDSLPNLFDVLPSDSKTHTHSHAHANPQNTTTVNHQATKAELKNVVDLAMSGFSLLHPPPPSRQMTKAIPATATTATANRTSKSPKSSSGPSDRDGERDRPLSPGGIDSNLVEGGQSFTHTQTERNNDSTFEGAILGPDGAVVGATVCLGCRATDTPEWRRGPLGPRTLCNACVSLPFSFSRLTC